LRKNAGHAVPSSVAAPFRAAAEKFVCKPVARHSPQFAQPEKKMNTMSLPTEKESASCKAYHESIYVSTAECLQLVDITDEVIAVLQRSCIRHGLANVQSLHTTAAVMVNENEPLLLEDMKKVLEALAPRSAAYQHDDFSIRTVNMCPEEERNGHSHCKAVFLRASETLNVVGGALQLGRWQRIFLIELDGAKQRSVSAMIIGQD
jgi:secondary thiamine-phosphate synthase enzyme